MVIAPFLRPRKWNVLLCRLTGMQFYEENTQVFARLSMARFGMTAVELLIIAYLNGGLWFWQIVMYYAVALMFTYTLFARVRTYRTSWFRLPPLQPVLQIVFETISAPALTILFIGKAYPPPVAFQLANIAGCFALIVIFDRMWKWKIPRND